MVCALRIAYLCAAALPVLASADLDVMDDCFFDSLSSAALSLLQKSATFVGIPGTQGERSDETTAEVAMMPQAPLLRSIVVPLRKVTATVPRSWDQLLGSDGFLSALTSRLKETSFYVGKVSLGNPAQQLDVVFDTSSLLSWVRHESCKSPACKEHRKYSPSKSATAADVDHSGVQLQQEHRLVDERAAHEEVVVHYTQSDLGEGNITARFVRDNLCLGNMSAAEACVDMTLATAVKLDDEPFRYMPGDGIIGLSLEGFGTSHMNSFLGRLFEASSNVLPHFGIWLGNDGGEIHLGGHELADLASPIHWHPVYRPEDGYWQAEIRSVRVGNATVNDCSGGCHAIVDTGVTHLGVQASLMPSLEQALVSGKARDGSCAGPDLTFELAGMELTLRAQDYADSNCVAQLGSLDLEEPLYNGVFTFGASVLRRYYAAFDWDEQRLGFALLSAMPIPAGQAVPRSMRGARIV